MLMNTQIIIMLRASAIVTRNFTDQFRSCFYTMPFLLRDFHTMLFPLMGILVSRYPKKNRSSSAPQNQAVTVKSVSVADAPKEDWFQTRTGYWLPITKDGHTLFEKVEDVCTNLVWETRSKPLMFRSFWAQRSNCSLARFRKISIA